jgi:hypothetical protein
MWFKKNFMRVPFRYQVQFFINLIRVKPRQSGYEGIAWARQRVWVRRMIEDKFREMCSTGRCVELSEAILGKPHPGAYQDK